MRFADVEQDGQFYTTTEICIPAGTHFQKQGEDEAILFNDLKFAPEEEVEPIEELNSELGA